jgi:hypothetical protein
MEKVFYAWSLLEGLVGGIVIGAFIGLYDGIDPVVRHNLLYAASMIPLLNVLIKKINIKKIIVLSIITNLIIFALVIMTKKQIILVYVYTLGVALASILRDHTYDHVCDTMISETLRNFNATVRTYRTSGMLVGGLIGVHATKLYSSIDLVVFLIITESLMEIMISALVYKSEAA